MDALLFHALTGVPLHRTLACFGDWTTLRDADRKLVRYGPWKSTIAAPDAAKSPAVAGLDADVFDRWSKPSRPRSAKLRRG